MVEKLSLDEAQEMLVIDKNNLDEECVLQPITFNHVSNSCSEAISIRDRSKEMIAIEYAKLYSKHKEKLINEGEKPTEKAIDSLIQVDPDYFKVVSENIDLKEIADKWVALKDAFMQRASMLKVLAQLHISNYYYSDMNIGDDELKMSRKVGQARVDKNKK